MNGGLDVLAGGDLALLGSGDGYLVVIVQPAASFSK